MAKLSFWRACLVAIVLLAAFTVPRATNAAVTVKSVPLDPANPTSPHFTYPLDALNDVTIVLGATVDLGGSADSFTYQWEFGDGATQAAAAITNLYDVSALHKYPASAAGGTIWTAKVTVTDTTTHATYTANYYVIQQANNLKSRVDVAIDAGLWYLHVNMWRCTNGSPGGCLTGGIYGANGIYGGWECALGGAPSCGGGYTFSTASAVTASNVQAFEVNGHFESGPATDPYTDDVKRGLARVFMFWQPQAVASKSYNYNLPSCPNGATTPCAVTFDGNTNGQMLFDVDSTGYPFYQGGQLIDAIVGSGKANALTYTGAAAGGGLPGVQGLSYAAVVQDAIDGYNYCQNNHTPGGAWAYQCNVNGGGGYNDNSVSQWAAIGEIGANRGFGISTPAIITDANVFWDTGDQCGTTGGFGYNGACSEPWGPWAVTPSGMVQLAMDKIGRGDSRWNMAETYYRNNFCNATALGAFSAPRQYTYGMFSFTKSMLLHNPGGVLTPITFLADQPGNTNPIDWYNSIGPESGGPDACDGVAQTLVKRQGTNGTAGGTVGSPNPTSPQSGFWEGHLYYGPQDPFETGWSIIMLRKTVFVSCVNNLVGMGTPSGRAAARIDLAWTGISGAASYDVLRGTTSGGPYTKIGNSTLPLFSDSTGLSNGGTYYYVVQPVNNAGGAVCQSNQAKITIPAQAR
jgi:hypothetical protein